MSHSFFLTCLWFAFLLVVDATKNQQCSERSKSTCPINKQSCNNTKPGACKTDNDCPCPQHCCVVNCKHACQLVPSSKNATVTPRKNGTASAKNSTKNSGNETSAIAPRSGGNIVSTVKEKNHTTTGDIASTANEKKNETANGSPKNQTAGAGNQKNQTNTTSITGAANAATKQNTTNPAPNNQSSTITPRSAFGRTANNATASINKTTTSTNGVKNETTLSDKDPAKPVNQTKAGNENTVGKQSDQTIITPRSATGKSVFPAGGNGATDDFATFAMDNDNEMRGIGGAEEIPPKDQQLDNDGFLELGELKKKKAKVARKPNKMPVKPANDFKESQATITTPKPKKPRPTLVPEEKEILKNLRQKMRRTQHAQSFQKEEDLEPGDKEDNEERERKSIAQKEDKRKIEREQQNVERRSLKEKPVSKPEVLTFDDKFREDDELESRKRKKTRKERIEDTDIEERNRKTKLKKMQEKNSDYDYPEKISRKKGKPGPTEKYPDYEDESKRREKDMGESDGLVAKISAGKNIRRRLNESNDSVDTMSARKTTGREMSEEEIPERPLKPPYKGEFFSGLGSSEIRQKSSKSKTEDEFNEEDLIRKRKKNNTKSPPKSTGDLDEDLPELNEEDLIRKGKKKTNSPPKSTGSLDQDLPEFNEDALIRKRKKKTNSPPKSIGSLDQDFPEFNEEDLIRKGKKKTNLPSKSTASLDQDFPEFNDEDLIRKGKNKTRLSPKSTKSLDQDLPEFNEEGKKKTKLPRKSTGSLDQDLPEFNEEGKKKTKLPPKSTRFLDKDLSELPTRPTEKAKPRRKNLGDSEYLPEESDKVPFESKVDNYEDLPKATRMPKRQRKLPQRPTESPEERQTEPKTRNFSTSTKPPLNPEESTDSADVPESYSLKRKARPSSVGDGAAQKRKPLKKPPTAKDMVMKHRDLILQMIYKVPRLLQKSVYKGRTVPPMVVKLPNGEYIYAPPFPGYDARPLEPEENESSQKAEAKKAQQQPFASAWNKFLLNSKPFGVKAPGNHPYPILMVITKPDDIFNMFPEQSLPSFNQYYSKLKIPFYINEHFNKNKTTNEPGRRPVQ